MRFAVVSDTHGNVANFKKALSWIKKENIQLVLHVGDIGSPESLQESLAGFSGQLFGVLGNMDKDYKILIYEYNKILNVKIQENICKTEIGGKSIAITHRPEGAKKLAESGKYDLVFYGHTHMPKEQWVDKCRMVNPGELAGQIFKPTFAVFDTETGVLSLKILEKIV